MYEENSVPPDCILVFLSMEIFPIKQEKNWKSDNSFQIFNLISLLLISRKNSY